MKRLWSIFTEDMERCFLTGSLQCHRHHIFGGAYRKKSEQYGFVVPLHHRLHVYGLESVHENPNQGLDLHLKTMAQIYFEKNHGSREDFRREFGKSWL